MLDKKYSEIQKIEIAGPGFINITLNTEAIRVALENTESVQTIYTGKKVLVEHSSPNLFKPFHIGHLMNNFIGESVVRIMKIGGAEVATMSFPSDMSLGIAKALYIIFYIDKKQDGGKDFPISFEHVKESTEYFRYFGEAYSRGVRHFEEKLESQDDIKEIARKLFLSIPCREIELYDHIRNINVIYFNSIVESLGSQINTYIFESFAGERGVEIIKNNIPNVFTESEGAVVYIPNESRKDINTTVFINSQGNPTYGGKDIGLIDIKFDIKHGGAGRDYSIYITDNEQIPHFKTVFAAAEEINEEWKSRIAKSMHVPHGRMTFKGAKMSSRLGGVPLAEDTIDAVLEEVRVRSGGHIAHLSAEEQEKIQRDIALSAIRISILRARPGSNINFDPDTSLSFEGDSGPYLLYTHARCASLLDKAKTQKLYPHKDTEKSISEVERKLLHYKEVLQTVVNDIAPQRLVTYLFELAQEFNSFYNDTTIIIEGDAKGTEHRLYIVEQTKNVLKEALYTLGINAPERM
ncbi:MAG: arginyl-tRNA synthetase [Candidatus Parcubacteria bacterium]|jgi:arginyl-tRNA synthetase